MKNHYLICTDLDRTLLPNGIQAESSSARPCFNKIAASEHVQLAYVSGRHLALVSEVINKYSLPVPDYIIGDVGSSIYMQDKSGWERLKSWDEVISSDWNKLSHIDIVTLLEDIAGLKLQENEKQATHKVSYYLEPGSYNDELLNKIKKQLDNAEVKANVIWSIDETSHTGLLDILPQCASKLHAIEYLVGQHNFSFSTTMFAGDSGNDLQVLSSHVKSTLVANAVESVRQEAITLAKKNDQAANLYIAHGDWHNMNGNYAAGIVEGLVHFFPEMESWLTF